MTAERVRQWPAFPAEPTSPMARVVAALTRVGSRRGSGSDWNCPAHDDIDPSLGVDEAEDGRVLFYCGAGCSTDDVIDALGLTFGDIGPDGAEHPPEVPEHAPKYQDGIPYDYHDESGALLFQVIRRECKGAGAQPCPLHKKRFRQRAPRPAGWRTGKGALDGVRRVPYRLPELLAAAEAHQPVVIVEGEKDANRVAAEGIAATTAPGGVTGGWDDEWSPWLRGASAVTVVADRDPAGYLRARTTVESLRRAGVSPVRIALPKPTHRTADYSDHAAAGYGFEELVEVELADLVWREDAAETAASEPAEVLREVARLEVRERARQLVGDKRAAEEFTRPPSRRTVADELAVEEPPLPYTVEQLHPEGGNSLLTAQYKAGKTTLALNILRALADDEPFLDGFPVAPLDGRVALWNYELSDRYLRDQLRALKIRNPDRAAVLNLRDFRMPLRAKVAEDFAVEWLTERAVVFWITDPFGAAYDGDENNNAEVRDWLKVIDVIKRRAGVRDLVLTAHTGRSRAEEGEERARGATRLDDWADDRWLLTEQEGRRYLRAHGRGVDVGEFSLDFDPTTKRLSVADYANRKVDRRETGVDSVVKVVAQHPGITREKLIRAITGRTQDRPSYIDEAERRGLIRVEKEGRSMLHYLVKVEKIRPNKKGPEGAK